MHKYSYHLILDEWVGTVTFRGYVRPNVYKILSALERYAPGRDKILVQPLGWLWQLLWCIPESNIK